MEADVAPDPGGGTSVNNMEVIIETNLKKRRADEVSPAESGDSKKNRSPAESIQSIYTKPEYDADGTLKYTDADKGPFIVHLVKKEQTENQGTSIEVLKLAQLIFKSNIHGIVDGGIKSVGRNRVALQFRTATEANDAVGNPFFQKINYTAEIPRFQVSRMGVIRGIPTDWSLEDVVMGIKSPPHCGEVFRARRLNIKSRKDGKAVWEPSSTVVISFIGQILPEKVFCYNMSLPVTVYQLPTIQCRKCCRFGHVRAQCRSQPRCFRCAQPHPGDECTVGAQAATCFLCRGGGHDATDITKCPEHSRQKSIKLIMSQENISFTEASARFPSSRKSYADVTSQSQPINISALNPSFDPIYPLPPNSPASERTSYRKTVFTQPRPKPQPGKTYDVLAHQQIINTPSSSQPNGCAYPSAPSPPPSTSPTPYATPNDNLIELLVCSLMNMVNKFSDALPNNVIQLLQQLLTTLINKNKNGSQSPPVEY